MTAVRIAATSVALSWLLLSTALAANITKEDFDAAWINYQAALNSGDASKTAIAAQSLYEIGSDFHDGDNVLIAQFALNYATALVEIGEMGSATKLFRRSVKLLERANGKSDISLVPALVGAGIAYYADAKSASALNVLRRALDITKSHFGETGDEYVSLLNQTMLHIGNSLPRNRRIEHFEYVYSVNSAAYGVGDARTGQVAYTLGQQQVAAGNIDEAEVHFLAALVAFESDSTDDVSAEYAARVNLVEIYSERDDGILLERHLKAITELLDFETDSELVSIISVSPDYPSQMRLEGLEATVDLSFTVNELGRVSDIVVLDTHVTQIEEYAHGYGDANNAGVGGFRRNRSTYHVTNSDKRRFSDAAVEALQRYYFKPRIVNGDAVPTSGVTTRIVFSLVPKKRW